MEMTVPKILALLSNHRLSNYCLSNFSQAKEGLEHSSARSEIPQHDSQADRGVAIMSFGPEPGRKKAALRQ